MLHVAMIVFADKYHQELAMHVNAEHNACLPRALHDIERFSATAFLRCILRHDNDATTSPGLMAITPPGPARQPEYLRHDIRATSAQA